MVAEGGYENAVADKVSADPMVRRDPFIANEQAVARRDPQIRRAPSSSGLYDVLDLILDKGIVIDAFVRVSLVGIELVTVDLRVVIASVDTYLRYAEGAERLQLYNRSNDKNLPEMVEGGKMGGLKNAAQKIGHKLTGSEDEGEPGQKNVAGSLLGGVRKIVSRVIGDDDENEEGAQQQRHAKPRHRDGSNGRGRERKGMAGSRR